MYDEYNENDKETSIKPISNTSSLLLEGLTDDLTNDDELETYENLKIKLNEDLFKFDILNWWKLNEYNYPILSKIAKDFLSMQSTSVSSEQLFSSSKLVITDRRNKLNEETIQYLMCLKSWNELFHKK